MSFIRLVYYNGVLAGWAAFLGWLISEVLHFGIAGGNSELIVVTGVVGGSIGAGVSMVSGFANGQWRLLVARASVGALGGAIGGILGGCLGNLLYAAGLPRAAGWI